jgi:hypothetical protein
MSHPNTHVDYFELAMGNDDEGENKDEVVCKDPCCIAGNCCDPRPIGDEGSGADPSDDDAQNSMWLT